MALGKYCQKASLLTTVRNDSGEIDWLSSDSALVKNLMAVRKDRSEPIGYLTFKRLIREGSWDWL